MKKKYYFQLLMLFLTVSVNAQTEWITTKLDEKLSVKFPSTPEKKIANGSISFVIETKDSITFTASILDYNVVANIDSTGLAALKDRQEFADQLRLGIVKQRADYEIGDIVIGKWKSHTLYQIHGRKRNDNKKLFLNMVIIGSKIYGISCLVPDLLETKDNEVFLNSLEQIKPETN